LLLILPDISTVKTITARNMLWGGKHTSMCLLHVSARLGHHPEVEVIHVL
jgi:hypothetical protein